jgi:hypothetical protein
MMVSKNIAACLVVIAVLLLSNGGAGGGEVGSSQVFTSHFAVTFPASVDKGLAHRLADRLEHVYEAVGQKFSYFPKDPFSVVLYPHTQFHAATVSPTWAQAVFDGTIRLPIEEAGANRVGVRASGVADSILIHEYIHAMAHRLSDGHVPAWLSEGLALYFDGGLKPWNTARQGRTQEYRPLRQLQGDLLDFPAHDARVVYRESYDATRVLIARYGLGRVRQLLQRLSVMPEFALAFETELSDRYVDFEQNWLAEHELKGF